MAGHSFVRRVDYVRRHARVVGPYLTPRKLANASLNEAECRFARARPRSLPPYIKLDTWQGQTATVNNVCVYHGPTTSALRLALRASLQVKFVFLDAAATQ